ncbi:MAG: hypothetical protein HZB66_02610 [Candidatus Aenigmarchaeota archaeon]|nr:hypothetical protein [Candidatus Aenigmarchaeota archaeon]
MKVVLILSVMIIIIISGCVQQQEVNTDANNGLVIKAFDTDISNIRESDRSFSIHMQVENVGGTTSRVALASLHGANWVPGYIYESLTAYSPLSPPDITVNPPTPGDFREVEWKLPTPDLPEGVIQVYDLTGRVLYEYSTSAVANLNAYMRDEYRRRTDLGETFSNEITCINSNAPVKVCVTGPHPMIVDKFYSDEPVEEYSYRVNFINVGTGMPITHVMNTYTGEVEAVDGLILGRIRVDHPAAFFSDCFGVSGVNEIELTPNDNVKLRKGQETTKQCTIGIDKTLWSERPEDTVTIIFELYYDYYTEKTIPVTITGERGDRRGVFNTEYSPYRYKYPSISERIQSYLRS